MEERRDYELGKLRDRVSGLEGRVGVIETRQERQQTDLTKLEQIVEKFDKKLDKVEDFLAKATGAFNMLRWVGIILSSLIGLGILSISLGG